MPPINPPMVSILPWPYVWSTSLGLSASVTAIIRIAVTTASRSACVLSVTSTRLFVITPAANSNTKAEEMATRDIRRVFLLMAAVANLSSATAAEKGSILLFRHLCFHQLQKLLRAKS